VGDRVRVGLGDRVPVGLGLRVADLDTEGVAVLVGELVLVGDVLLEIVGVGDLVVLVDDGDGDVAVA
jgi:hypothetical protein